MVSPLCSAVKDHSKEIKQHWLLWIPFVDFVVDSLWAKSLYISWILFSLNAVYYSTRCQEQTTLVMWTSKCLFACVRACVFACVRVCVCLWKKHREIVSKDCTIEIFFLLRFIFLFFIMWTLSKYMLYSHVSFIVLSTVSVYNDYDSLKYLAIK